MQMKGAVQPGRYRVYAHVDENGVRLVVSDLNLKHVSVLLDVEDVSHVIDALYDAKLAVAAPGEVSAE